MTVVTAGAMIVVLLVVVTAVVAFVLVLSLLVGLQYESVYCVN